MLRGRDRTEVAARAVAVPIVIVLGVAAARTDLQAHPGNVWYAAADVLIGVAFVLGAFLAPGVRAGRALAAATGVVWLASSTIPALELVPLALIAVLLATFPSAQPRTRVAWMTVVLVVPIALGMLPLPLRAVLFAIIALDVRPSARQMAGSAYPLIAAAAMGAALGLIWLDALRLLGLSFDARSALFFSAVAYVAIAYPIALVRLERSGRRLAERLLGEGRPEGLQGLQEVLAEALGDPGLRIRRVEAVNDPTAASDDARRGPLGSTIGRPAHAVQHDGRVVAIVEHGPGPLQDPAVLAELDRVIRLVLLDEHWQQEAERTLEQLAAARDRQVAATDRERRAIAARLAREVIDPIARAQARLAARPADLSDAATHALATAATELDAARRVVDDVVAGVPPADLGHGGLAIALADLARRSPVPVRIQAAGRSRATPEAESALYHVCSEAIANAIKHARPHAIDVAVHAEPDGLGVQVVDDGCGGALASGAGIRGMADRLAACGGRLQVESPPGAGTTITAWVPVSRS